MVAEACPNSEMVIIGIYGLASPSFYLYVFGSTYVYTSKYIPANDMIYFLSPLDYNSITKLLLHKYSVDLDPITTCNNPEDFDNPPLKNVTILTINDLYNPVLPKISVYLHTNALGIVSMDQKLYDFTGNISKIVFNQVSDLQCLGPFIQKQMSVVNYDFNLDPVQFFDSLMYESCIGTRTYIQDKFSYYNSTSDTNFKFNKVISKINVTINYTADYDKYVGSRYIGVFPQVLGSGGVAKSLLTRFIPKSEYVKDVTAPDHNFKSCSQKIYPLFWGESYQVQIQQSTLDDYGNILMAGSSDKLPFSQILSGVATLLQGFVALFDQRAQPLWIYTASQIFQAAYNQTCVSVSQYGEYVYALCTLRETEYLYSRDRILALLKFQHSNGMLIYSTNLPNNTNQQGDFVQGLAGDKVLVLFRYFNNANNLTGQAALVYDDIIESPQWYKLYNSNYQEPTFLEPTPRTYLVNQGTGFYYIFESVPNLFFQTYKVNIATGLIEAISRCTQVSQVTMGFFYATFFSTNQIIQGAINMIIGSNIAIIQIINQNDLTVTKQVKLSFGTGYQLGNIAIEVMNNNQDIYVVFSEKQIVVAKLDANLQSQKYTTFKNIYSSAKIQNIKSFNNELLYFFNTQTVQAKYSATIMRSDAELNFEEFQIFSGESIDLQSTDQTWKIQADSTISTPNTLITDFSPGIDGNILTQLMLKSTNLNWTTQSYSPSIVKRNDNGLSIMRLNFFNGKQHSPGPIINENLEAVFTYEIVRATGIQEIQLQQLQDQSICFDRPIKIVLICTINNNEIMFYPYVKLDNITNKIIVNTTMINNVNYFPGSYYVKVRYQDAYQVEAKIYFETIIQIRIVNSANISISQSNFTQCTVNPFAFSYNFKQIFPLSLFLTEDDENMILGGYARILSGSNEAFVMRLSQTGRLEWIVVILSLVQSQVNSVLQQNYQVYCQYRTVNQFFDSQEAIVKMTYGEGKIIWARKIQMDLAIFKSKLAFADNYEIVVDPFDPSRFAVLSKYRLDLSSRYIIAFSMLQDDSDGLINPFNIFIKDQSTQVDANNQAGSIIFDLDQNCTYFTGFIRNKDNNTGSGSYDGIIVKADSITGQIIWAKSFWHSATQYKLAQNNPNIIQSKFDKTLIIVAPIKKDSQILKVSTDGQLIRKVRIVTNSYEIRRTMIVQNPSNQNIILVSQTDASFGRQMVYLDKDLKSIDGGRILSSPLTQNFHTIKFVAQTSKYFIIATTDSMHSSTFSLEPVINKFSFNWHETSKYQCVGFTLILDNNIGVIQDSDTNFIDIQADAQIQTTSTFTYQVDFLRSVQVHPYQNISRLPVYFGYDGPTKIQLIPASYKYYCQESANVPPSEIDFPEFTMKQGSTGMYQIDALQVKQCQGYSSKIKSIYNEQKLQSFTKPYLSMKGNIITIDGTQTTLQPSFRLWYIFVESSNAKATLVQLPIFVWPSSFQEAPRNESTSTCTGIIFPKAIAAADGDFEHLNSDMDDSNGNFLICGINKNSQHQLKDYNTVGRGGVIALFGITGKPYWAYSALLPQNRFITSCIFSVDKSSVYSLVGHFISTGYIQGFMKQKYESGKFIYIKQLQNNVLIQGEQKLYFQTFLSQDPYTNDLYLSYKRFDTGFGFQKKWQAQLFKIRDENNQAELQWTSRFQNLVEPNTMYIYHQAQYEQDSEYMYCVGSTLLYLPNGTLGLTNVISKINKRIGTFSFVTLNVSTNSFEENRAAIILDSGKLIAGFVNRTQKIVSMTTLNTNLQVIDSNSFSYSFVQPNETKSYEISMIKQVFTSALTFGLKMYIYNGYMYLLHSGQSYKYLYQSSVFDRYTLDFNAPDSCVASLLQNVSPLPTLSSNANTALLNFQAQFTLQTVYDVGKFSNQDAGFYMELINYSVGFGYSQATLLGCPNLVIDWPDDPKDLFIKLPQVDLVTQVIKQAQLCTGERLLFSWKADHFNPQPTAIFSTDAPEGSQMNINATALGIGIYSISVSFSQGVDQTLTKSFKVVISPPQNFTKPIIAECQQTIYPFYTNSITLTYNYADATFDDSVLVLCGMSNSDNVPVINKAYPFFAFYNKNIIQNYWLTLQSGLGDGEATFCQFDDTNNNLFSIVQAKSTAIVAIYDTVYAYKIDPIGRLVSSKMLQTAGNQLLAPYGTYDNNTKSFYISGTIEQSSLMLTNQSGFIWKLDDNLNTIYFSVYSLYSLNVFPQAIASSVGGYAHQLVGRPTSSGKLHIGVLNLLANGTIFSSKFFISTIPDSYKTGSQQTEYDIVYRNQYVYSAFSYLIMAPTEFNEIYVSKHIISSGSLSQQRVFILPDDQGTAISITFIEPDPYFYLFVEGKQKGKSYIFKMSEYMAFIEFFISYPTAPSSDALALNSFRSSKNIYFMYSYKPPSSNYKNLMISKFKIEDMSNIKSTSYYCSSLYNQELSGIDTKVKASVNGASNSLLYTFWTILPVISKVYSISEMKSFIQSASMQINTCITQSPATPGVTKDFVGERAIFISKSDFFLNISPFKQCQGVNFTTNMIYSYQKSNVLVFEALPSWIVLVETDISAPYLIVSPTSNSQAGNYTLIYNSTFLDLLSYRQSSAKIQLQVNPNQPPFLQETFNKTVTIYGMHSFRDVIYFDKDIEYNEAVIWLNFYDTQNSAILSTTSWVKVNSNSSELVEYELENPPNPSANTVYYLKFFVADEYNMLSPRHFSKFFYHENFIDMEGDNYTVDCNTILKPSTSPNKDWIEFTDYENGTYSIIGATPKNNQFAGIYTINCLLSDGFSDSPSTFQITVNVIAKPQIKLLYHPVVHSNWLQFDDQNMTFQFVPRENKYQGLHELHLKFDDEISTPTYLKFFVTIIPNYGLKSKGDLPNRIAIANNNFMFHTNVISLFTNPEKMDYSFYFREYAGFATEDSIGEYNIELVGVDDSFLETVISFTLRVQRNFLKECQLCEKGFFYFENGCYSQCPQGYYEDNIDSSCKQLFQSNEFGIVTRQGYYLSNTACIIPKCSKGQFFKWETNLQNGVVNGQCENCHPSCKNCIGFGEFQCLDCYLGYEYISENRTCIKCEDILGMFTNEEMECEDLCGDGIIVDKNCDDGNQNNGDGCSNKCEVEAGFSCPFANYTCHEIIPPFLTITSITQLNLIMLEFSEPIKIENEIVFTPENLKIEIKGSKLDYKFDWRIVEQSKQQLVPGRKIDKFQIILSEMKQSLYGSEEIRVSFQNSTLIKDLANNTLLDQYASTNPYPFTYLSPEEKKVSTSGDIEFPPQVSMFTSYLTIASGDIDLQSFVPSVMKMIIIEEDLYEPIDSQKFYYKFQADNLTPYVAISYGEKISLWMVSILVILPFALILSKKFKTVKLFQNLIQGFFYNVPLRTFIELYLELILIVLINTQFVKFSNRSQIFASITLFFVGSFSILLPFLLMTAIFQNRKNIEKRRWINSLGILTEDLQSDHLLQIYYYPLFIFQRLTICAILVFAFSYPLIQCAMALACNFTMIIYLINIKPFKQENLQATTVLDEVIIMLIIIIFTLLTVNDYNVDERKNYGWIIVALIAFSIIKNFSVAIYFGCSKASQSYQNIFLQEDKEIDSPHSSDNESVLSFGSETFDGHQNGRNRTKRFKNLLNINTINDDSPRKAKEITFQ
ncbi:cadg multi-domain protein [Stylonychia lemnae]|uniref:Cadg multi-domain protein n=1 Tax=Stylonychia lemnae TaxID=5949 RepID=A0A078AYH0_STYLE|nr:cadg multi-domain protein [Stylonychia lemnae]|eukprot:CDW87181.1 cadg multi-domain protein [Stylonychia lemnae]